MLISTDKVPMPNVTENSDYLALFLPGTQPFLDFAKKESHPGIEDAMSLYYSGSQDDMQNLCSSVLKRLEKKAHSGFKVLNANDFFSICILHMVSRASKTAKQAISGENDISLVSTPNSNKKSKATEIKILDLLFDLIRRSSDLSLFDNISDVTGRPRYNPDRHGKNLMRHVDFCLFRSPLATEGDFTGYDDILIEVPTLE